MSRFHDGNEEADKRFRFETNSGETWHFDESFDNSWEFLFNNCWISVLREELFELIEERISALRKIYRSEYRETSDEEK
jgi:hypothetical protein